jgi:hypothetical protein
VADRTDRLISGVLRTPVFALTRALVLAVAMMAVGGLSGCSQRAAPEGYEIVNLDGREFTLELAADDATRFKGLGGRESLPEYGGMLFVFAEARVQRFLMRDCVIDLDIIFLDSDGRILAMHHMPAEEPIRPDETRTREIAPGRAVMGTYEQRLKTYSSRFNARYVIEIRGGMLETLDLQTGQQVKLDTEKLQSLVR